MYESTLPIERQRLAANIPAVSRRKPPARKISPKKKVKTDPRAMRSGFAPKLRAWLDYNRDEYEADRDTGDPRNPRQLSKLLTTLGEAISDTAVRAWKKGHSLPEARLIGLLERLMGAPWAHLDDPETSWPMSPTPASFVALLSLVSDEERAGYLDALRKQLSAATRGATRQ